MRAGAQHGVLTVEQAIDAGLSKSQVTRLVSAGVLERCDVGILRVSGSSRSTLQDLQIATLRAGQHAAVSHVAAAWLWEVEGFDRGIVEVSVPKGTRRRPRVGTLHEVSDLDRIDTTRLAGFRVTTPPRTIVDVAPSIGPVRLEVAVDDLLRRRLTSFDRLAEVATRLSRPGRSGPAAVLDLLGERTHLDGLTDTGFETLLLQILRHAGLPRPTTQHVLLDSDGRFVARFDAAYVDEKVGIEADSERWHMDRRRFVADRARRALAEALGWRVLAFTHHHVTREAGFVADTVARTLEVARAA